MIKKNLNATIRRGKSRKPHFICIILVLLSALFTQERSHAGSVRLEARVTRVHDGDTVTLRMKGKLYRTRLIGIDAPEMGQEPWGRKAKEHLRQLVKETGGKVTIETDVTKSDKYNRLLAYLWADDKTMINAQMVRDGYAMIFIIQPNSAYVELLKKAQQHAQSGKRGIWGLDGLKERPLDYKKAHPRN